MLKVCGVTYTHSPNYGTCLQAYALQRAVEKTKIGNETCEYRLLPIKKCKGFPGLSSEKGIKSKIKWILSKYNRLPFQSFDKQYMKYAPRIPLDKLDQLNELFDAFVCGSDIIWNPKYNKSIGAYYLDFTKKYSFSYAASFGAAEADPLTKEKFGKKIDHLDNIGVREESSAEIARQFTSKPVSIVVDPVLLLEKEEWEKVALPKKNDEKYILYYATGVNSLIEQFAKKLEQQTGLKVIVCASNSAVAFTKHKLQVDSPQRWLQLIKDAEYVVTNSFHATLFSILFHKNFYTLTFDGTASGLNMRMVNFLNAVNLNDRIYYQIPEKVNLESIDYGCVENTLGQMKKQSLTYLYNNLDAAYQQKQQREGK